MLQCLLYCSFDMEPRKFISYSLENWDPYVSCEYKTISEQFQGAEKYIFLYSICVIITFHCTVVNCREKLSTISFKINYILNCHITNFSIFIDLALLNLFIQHVSRCWLCTVSLCNIVMMEDKLKLARSWCQIGYLKKKFLVPWYHSEMVFTWHEHMDLNSKMNWEWKL